eukprot:6208533-Pleurochrysis_carterae.AAC.3
MKARESVVAHAPVLVIKRPRLDDELASAWGCKDKGLYPLCCTLHIDMHESRFRSARYIAGLIIYDQDRMNVDALGCKQTTLARMEAFETALLVT